MADKIKHIAAFSEDAINVALQALSEDQWTHFKDGLDILRSSLGEKKERKKVESNEFKISDETIFKEHILVQIKKRVVEDNNVFSIIVDFQIKTDYTSSSIEQMLIEHAAIIQTEEGMKVMILLAQFSRGLLYLNLAEKLKQNGINIREFVEKGDLSVAFITVLRYMTLTTMVLKYPRLLICQLTFTQLMKHKTRLLNYLSQKEGHELHCRLSVPFDVIANGHKIQICHGEIITPAEKFDTSPDWGFRDIHTKPKTTDEKVQAVLESRNAVDEEASLALAMEVCMRK